MSQNWVWLSNQQADWSTLDEVFFVSTINNMNVSFDPIKSERNERERGLPFSLVAQFDWSEH